MVRRRISMDHSELFCQIVECALDGERCLRGRSHEAAARQQLVLNGIAVAFFFGQR